MVENRLRCDVILTGCLSEEEKLVLYDLAKIFVFPSLYEGFGIPLLEAMARKVPIVASRIPSTGEIGGDSVIYYGNPTDHETLAQQIIELLENDALKQKLIEKGSKQVRKFALNKITKRYLKAYQEVLEDKE